MALSGPIIALRRRSRRGKVLVLAMMIYYPSYLRFMTCRIGFDQSYLITSNSLAVLEDI